MKISKNVLNNPEFLKMQEQFLTNAWWVSFAEFFKNLGEVAYLQEKRDNFDAEIAKIRGQYISKGRPFGWRKDKSKAA